MSTFQRQACSFQYPLSQATLLALLPSNIDPQFILDLSTGLPVSYVGVPQNVVTANVNKGVWQYIERANPRKWLLYSTANWKITSFDPSSGTACIVYLNPVGNMVNFSFNLPVIRNG